MARIVVIGPGSIGGYFAVEAARNGHELVLCSRSPFAQLSVQQLDGSTRVLDVAARTDSATAIEGDWVWLATKAQQTDAAAEWLRRSCGRRTQAVVVMQNGVEHEARVRAYIRDIPVLPAIVLCGAEAIAPGRVVHHGFANLEVPTGALATDLAAIFAGTDAHVIATDDFTTVMWRKLVSNVTASVMTALTLQRLAVMRRPDIQALAIGLARECLAVGKAAGARLDTAMAESMVLGMASANPAMGSSMLYDRLAKRPTEHEALTGAVVRGGALYRIDTPLNAAMLAMLAAVSESGS